MVKKLFIGWLVVLGLFLPYFTDAQTFLNGSFETNTAAGNLINMNNAAFTAAISNTTSFGTTPNGDLITIGWGTIQNGLWKVALTGGGTDIFGLELSAPLVAGNSYTFTFWDLSFSSWVSNPLQLGLSTTSTTQGTVIHTTAAGATNGVWTQRTVTFTAPNNGQYITVRQTIGTATTSWVMVDNFVMVTVSPPPITFADTNHCLGDSTFFTLSDTARLDSALWSFDDPATGTANASQEFNPHHIFSAPGTYNVQVLAYDTNGTTIDTVIQPVTILDTTLNLNLGNDTTLCTGDSLVLDAFNSGATYLWQDNSTDSALVVSGPGTYAVTVTTPCAIAIDSIVIDYENAPVANLGNDTTLCDGASYQLNVVFPNATYLWHTGATGPTYNVTTAELIFVTVTNGCGSTTDSLQVDYDSPFTFDLGPNTTLCSGATMLLSPSIPGATYLWQNASTNNSFLVSSPGQHWVAITNACGTESDSINVSYLAPPSPDLGNDTTLCEGSSYTLDASFTASTYLWQNSTLLPTMLVDAPITYAVSVTNMCGVGSDSIVVNYDSLFTVDLGPDAVLCLGMTLPLDANVPNASYVWQNASTSQQLNAVNTNTYIVTVTNACGTETDSLYAEFLDVPVVNLGADAIHCTGAVKSFDVTFPGSTYLWQDGDTNAAYSTPIGGLFSVQVTNMCGTSSDEILLTQLDPPTVDLGNDVVICQSEQHIMDAAFDQATYLWSNGFTTPALAANVGGQYWVRVTNACGMARDTAVVDVLVRPEIDLNVPAILCTGDNRTVDATVAFATNYLWDNGDTNPLRTLNASGIYTVTVSNFCGSAFDSFELIELSPPVLELPADPDICVGTPYSVSTGPINGILLWQDNSSDTLLEITKTGLYWVEATNQCGADKDSIWVTYRNYPFIELGVDTAICPQDSITLRGFERNVDYTWNTGATTAAVVVGGDQNYSVTVTNKYGCSVQDEIFVDRLDCSTIYIPNAFTPNGDRHNEKFLVQGTDIAEFSLRIYNRWGELLFHTNDINEGWEGYSKDFTPAPNGVYLWKIRYKGAEHREYQDLEGRLTVYR